MEGSHTGSVREIDLKVYETCEMAKNHLVKWDHDSIRQVRINWNYLNLVYYTIYYFCVIRTSIKANFELNKLTYKRNILNWRTLSNE